VTSEFYPESVYESDQKIREQFGLPRNKKIILFKGRMVKEKGIIELIKAFSAIDKNDILLLIVGSKNFGEKRSRMSSYETELMNMIQQDDRIQHIGYVPYNDIPKLNKISYMCVVPSIWEEPAGLVVLEAIASETPLVVSDAGGIPEYVKPDYTNIVARDSNYIENLTSAMMKLLDDEEYYLSVMRKIKKERDIYNEERYYDNLCKVLD
jgi:spore coat protein SA